jgi:hypothetical protein
MQRVLACSPEVPCLGLWLGYRPGPRHDPPWYVMYRLCQSSCALASSVQAVVPVGETPRARERRKRRRKEGLP